MNYSTKTTNRHAGSQRQTYAVAGRGLAGAAAANLRFCSRMGAMVATGLPRRVADRPLVALCMLGPHHLIASEGCCLYALDRRAGAATLLADLGAGNEAYCAIGGSSRAIVMTSAGAQHIVLAGEDEAVCLGALPQLPPVAVELREVMTITETAGAIRLSDPDALRGGALGAADASALAAELDKAWERVAARARAGNAAIVPSGASITVEIRQLDGQGAAVGSRGRMAISGGGLPGQIDAPLEGDMLGPVTLSVGAMRLRISIGALGGEDAAAWGSGQVMAEVASGSAPELTVRWTMRVDRPASGSPRVVVIPVVEAVPAEADEPLQSVARVAAGAASEVEAVIPAVVTDPVAEIVEATGLRARCVAVSGDVVMWGCLDGAPGDVAVATAASPLSLVSRATVGVDPVAALVAAPRLGSAALSPGCAHFYGFTSGGILNIQVGSRRGAPVASLLDRRGVGKPGAVAVGAGQVVAIADGGNQLIALRGGRSETLGRYPDHHFVAAAMHGVANELWLLEGDGNITTVDPDSGDMSRRYLPYTPVALGESGGSLWLTAPDGLMEVEAARGEWPAAVEWRMALPLEPASALTGLTAGIIAPGGFKGRIAVWAVGWSGPDRPEVEPQWQVALDGAPRSPLQFRLPLPMRAGAVVEISGIAGEGFMINRIEYTAIHAD